VGKARKIPIHMLGRWSDRNSKDRVFLCGKYFTPQEKEVWGNLYGKYGDRIAELLNNPTINFTRIT